MAYSQYTPGPATDAALTAAITTSMNRISEGRTTAKDSESLIKYREAQVKNADEDNKYRAKKSEEEQRRYDLEAPMRAMKMKMDESTALLRVQELKNATLAYEHKVEMFKRSKESRGDLFSGPGLDQAEYGFASKPKDVPKKKYNFKENLSQSGVTFDGKLKFTQGLGSN